jgi:hypothetical protein
VLGCTAEERRYNATMIPRTVRQVVITIAIVAGVLVAALVALGMILLILFGRTFGP